MSMSSVDRAITEVLDIYKEDGMVKMLIKSKFCLKLGLSTTSIVPELIFGDSEKQMLHLLESELT